MKLKFLIIGTILLLLNNQLICDQVTPNGYDEFNHILDQTHNENGHANTKQIIEEQRFMETNFEKNTVQETSHQQELLKKLNSQVEQIIARQNRLRHKKHKHHNKTQDSSVNNNSTNNTNSTNNQTNISNSSKPADNNNIQNVSKGNDTIQIGNEKLSVSELLELVKLGKTLLKKCGANLERCQHLIAVNLNAQKANQTKAQVSQNVSGNNNNSTKGSKLNATSSEEARIQKELDELNQKIEKKLTVYSRFNQNSQGDKQIRFQNPIPQYLQQSQQQPMQVTASQLAQPPIQSVIPQNLMNPLNNLAIQQNLNMVNKVPVQQPVPQQVQQQMVPQRRSIEPGLWEEKKALPVNQNVNLQNYKTVISNSKDQEAGQYETVIKKKAFQATTVQGEASPKPSTTTTSKDKDNTKKLLPNFLQKNYDPVNPNNYDLSQYESTLKLDKYESQNMVDLKAVQAEQQTSKLVSKIISDENAIMNVGSQEQSYESQHMDSRIYAGSMGQNPGQPI